MLYGFYTCFMDDMMYKGDINYICYG